MRGAAADGRQRDASGDNGDRSGKWDALGGVRLYADFSAADFKPAALLVREADEKGDDTEDNQDDADSKQSAHSWGLRCGW